MRSVADGSVRRKKSKDYRLASGTLSHFVSRSCVFVALMGDAMICQRGQVELAVAARLSLMIFVTRNYMASETLRHCLGNGRLSSGIASPLLSSDRPAGAGTG